VLKWIVLAPGAIMSVAGFVWLWQGLGIVQVERGWSAVIAGSVIFAAGAVLMGLAGLIRQIEKLGAPAQGFAPVEVHSHAAAPVLEHAAAPALEDQPRAEPAPREAPAREDQHYKEPLYEPRLEKPVRIEEAGSRELAHQGVEAWEREQQNLELDLETQKSSLTPALKSPPGLPHASVPDFTSGKQLSSGNLGESREDVAEKSAPKLEAPKLEARRSEPLATDVSATAHWKSILSRAKPGDGAAKGGVAAPMVVSPVAQPGLTPTPTPTPTPAPAPPAEAGGDGRIARRYESQGVRYSLYEDGSIDAETETGVFRFGSLTELRAFLDQRKG